MSKARGAAVKPARKDRAGSRPVQGGRDGHLEAAPPAPARRAGGERRARAAEGATKAAAGRKRGAAASPLPKEKARPRRAAQKEVAPTSVKRKRARASQPPPGAGKAAKEPRVVSIVPSLDWDDGLHVAHVSEEIVARWIRRGDELIQKLESNGAREHEYRADLKQGRFVWLSPEGHVSAEARAEVVCSWSCSTHVIAMAWADPLIRPAGIPRIDGIPAERDGVDEETAWRVAMQAAEGRGAEYLYRVKSPHAWYFLALSDLTFEPTHPLFSPSTPVGLVLRQLAETRQAISSHAEPADVVRDRLTGTGNALLSQASYAYRDTDWVPRLQRTGKRLMHLASNVPRPTFSSVAAGKRAGDWVDRDVAVELVTALSLLEDEWAAFS